MSQIIPNRSKITFGGPMASKTSIYIIGVLTWDLRNPKQSQKKMTKEMNNYEESGPESKRFRFSIALTRRAYFLILNRGRGGACWWPLKIDTFWGSPNKLIIFWQQWRWICSAAAKRRAMLWGGFSGVRLSCSTADSLAIICRGHDKPNERRITLTHVQTIQVNRRKRKALVAFSWPSTFAPWCGAHACF